MQTKYSFGWSYNRFWFMTMVVIIILTLLLGNSAQKVQAKELEPGVNFSQCSQADFHPDSVVKNGHSIDQNDLYTRHQICDGDFVKKAVEYIEPRFHRKNHTTVSPVISPTVTEDNPGNTDGDEPPAQKSCHNGKDNTNKNGKHDCSGNHPDEHSGQEHHKEHKKH